MRADLFSFVNFNNFKNFSFTYWKTKKMYFKKMDSLINLSKFIYSTIVCTNI